MGYIIGNIYSISLESVIQELEGKSSSELVNGDKFYLSHGYVLCSIDEFTGQTYLDFYDNENNLAICDGEEAQLLDMSDYSLTFEGLENEVPAPFKLSFDEADAAVYE